MSRPIPALIALGAAAVIVFAAVVFLRPAPSERVGDSNLGTTSFTSSQNGYTVDVPSSWQVVAATKPWPSGQRIETDPTSVDTFQIPGSPINAMVRIAAQPIPDRTTATTWLASWQRIREVLGGHCLGSASPWLRTTVAGLPAWKVGWRCDSAVDERAAYDEYVFPVGPKGYVISGTPSMVDLMLRTFRVPAASGSAEAAPSPIGTTDWTTYTSAQYGFSISHPTAWSERPATRAWTVAADGASFEPSSPARDSFLNEGRDVQVSAWSIGIQPGTGPKTQADLESWVQHYCEQTDEHPCTGIHDRAVALCVERRDCHPGLLVPFTEDVLAFWPAVGDDASVIVVAVWRADSDASVEAYGGSVVLLEAFLSTFGGGGNAGVYPAASPSTTP